MHFRIREKDNKYGLAEEYCVHRTLLDLVIHYEEISLKELNPRIDIKLIYPFKARDIYKYYDQEQSRISPKIVPLFWNESF